MLKVDKLRFGTAGMPLSTPSPNTENAIKYVRQLNLDALELEFVRNVFLKEEKAKFIGEVAKKEDVVLTAHAPYYINLNAKEEEKIKASIKRIKDSVRAVHFAKGYSVVFHPGFYFKDDPKKVYEKIKSNIKILVKELQDEGIDDVWVRPETMGKPTQFGSLNEVINLSLEVENVMPCVDFAHLHARSIGKYNTKKEFEEILNLIEKNLGREGLNNMHVHFSGINYGDKGEKNHLVLKESDFNYEEWVKTIKEYKVKGVFISESPNIEEDALFIKKLYEKM